MSQKSLSLQFLADLTEFNRPDRVLQLPTYELETESRVVCGSTKSFKDVCDKLAQTPDWGHNLLKVQKCWQDFGCQGNGVTVAVLDTGVDSGHPDLKVSTGKDFTGSPYGWADAQGHGTHCAGIIAAKNNTLGVVGVAPNATLIAGKVLSDSGSGTIEGIASGIDWAVTSGAHVISMSLGGDGPISGILRTAIDRAIAAGVIVVVAAGNSGPYPDTVGSPGNYTPCVTVAAVDSSSRVASFSSRGPQLDVAAPGVQIMSTYPGGQYTALSGTSMATPYVAGIAALFVEYAKRLNVKPTQKLFESYVTATSLDLGQPGHDIDYGFGLIQPSNLLQKLKNDFSAPVPPPTPTPTPPPTPPTPIPGPDPVKAMSLKLTLLDKSSMVIKNVTGVTVAPQ